jgi:transcription elongation factor Elf1
VIEPGLEPLEEQRCPICGHRHFNLGPAGGLNVNIECERCGQRFNVCVYDGVLILAQTIAYNGLWPDRGQWRVDE